MWLPTHLCHSDLLLLVARRVRGEEVHDLVTVISLFALASIWDSGPQ